MGADPYLSDGTGIRPAVWITTVQDLLAEGLVHLDTTTSASAYTGQLLSLTDQGKAALRDLEDQPAAEPRAAAALRRSPHRTSPAPEQTPPPTGPDTAFRPTRSR